MLPTSGKPHSDLPHPAVRGVNWTLAQRELDPFMLASSIIRELFPELGAPSPSSCSGRSAATARPRSMNWMKDAYNLLESPSGR